MPSLARCLLLLPVLGCLLACCGQGPTSSTAVPSPRYTSPPLVTGDIPTSGPVVGGYCTATPRRRPEEPTQLGGVIRWVRYRGELAGSYWITINIDQYAGPGTYYARPAQGIYGRSPTAEPGEESAPLHGDLSDENTTVFAVIVGGLVTVGPGNRFTNFDLTFIRNAGTSVIHLTGTVASC